MNYAGVDVGKSGAITIMDEYGEIISTMPKVPWESDRLGAREIYERFSVWAKDGLTVTVEKVNSFGQGRTSAFTFGRSVGGIMAVVDILKLPYIPVTPQTWKKTMMVGYNYKEDGKGASIKCAYDLFPTLRPKLKLKSSHNLAESALIAEYGRRIISRRLDNA